ncbi:MAG: ATP synthase F1 subunit delta [Pseudomonadota bacterium]
MIGSNNIAKRYARAFFEIAEEEKQFEKYYHELQSFSDIVDGNESLKEFLANPIFDQHDKRDVVDAVLNKIGMTGITANFLRLLADKRRIGILADIVVLYRELMDSALKRQRVQVITAFPLSSDLAEHLKKGMEGLTGKQIELKIEQDASLLAGIVVRVGDILYDGSIKTQLNNIRNLLGEEI